jgi:glycosyltransferase involved in cell wall biosynthesis
LKVALVAHGYPPELVGGTETALQSLARGLARRGVEVLVIAGSLEHEAGFRTSADRDAHPSGEGREIRVRRIHRADLYFDHWQKSGSVKAARAFREILAEERPELLHVHHWIRLSHDLVALAAELGIPACVTLHDLWTSCLVTFRVRPDSGEYCEVPLAPSPCLACAAQLPPRTPWVTTEAQHVALFERKRAIARELELARAVIVPTRAHARELGRYLGLELEQLALRVVPHGRDLALRRADPLPPPAQHGKLVLGAWGHLHRLKGADRVVAALRELADPRAVELHLAGGEPDAAYARAVRELARGLDVRFHGPYAAERLDEHPVSRVHAFVSGTRAHESWGLVLDEAVALGLPLVLPRSGAYAERLAEGAGALFYDSHEPGSLARVLARLIAEPGLLAELRRSLPDPTRFCPSVEAALEPLLAIYRDVLAHGPPPAVKRDRAVERVRDAAEEAWDASLARRSAEELGLS